jgi:CubicO group peptidase (beta-lactamase class C family)
MKAAAAIVAMVLGLAGCASAPDDALLPARVDALLAPRVAAHEFTGAVVLMRAGRVVYARGFGLANREAGLVFTPETPSDGGSLAKTFTAAGLGWLVHEGRIAPDAPVVRYLPEYPHAPTTVRQLISHSNGLPPYYEFFDPHFAAGAERTTPALLGVVARVAPAPGFEPGVRFEYSNLGFDAAALVIERTLGQSYADFVRERFFAPLGMTASFARPARLADWPGVRTRGYRFHEGSWRDLDAFDGEAFLGASNLYFSAADLARWGDAFATGRALPAAVFAAGQQRPAIAGRPSPINALSWYCSADGQRCHYTGSVQAFHAFLHWDRERQETVAFVSNSALPPWPTITLQRDLVDALAGRVASVPAAAGFDRFDRRSRATVAGRYAAEGIGRVALSADGQALRLQVDDGLVFDVFQVSREVFYVPGPDWWLAFSSAADGRRLHLRSMALDTVAAREPG